MTMMRRSTSALLLVLLVVAGSSSSLCLADTKTVFVDTLEPVSVTSDSYLSVTIDASRICHDFAPLNFTDDDVVITMARALAPAYAAGYCDSLAVELNNLQQMWLLPSPSSAFYGSVAQKPTT